TTITYFATDNVGNVEGAKSLVVKLDKTPPIVSVTGFTDGATFYKGDPLPTVGCSVSDSAPGSGVASAGIPAIVAGGLNANGVGYVAYQCNAPEHAGNQSAASATYHIIYNFGGFRPPIDPLPAMNIVKAGSAVPVKFSLHGYQGLNIFETNYPKPVSMSCG